MEAVPTVVAGGSLKEIGKSFGKGALAGGIAGAGVDLALWCAPVVGPIGGLIILANTGAVGSMVGDLVGNVGNWDKLDEGEIIRDAVVAGAFNVISGGEGCVIQKALSGKLGKTCRTASKNSKGVGKAVKKPAGKKNKSASVKKKGLINIYLGVHSSIRYGILSKAVKVIRLGIRERLNKH